MRFTEQGRLGEPDHSVTGVNDFKYLARQIARDLPTGERGRLIVLSAGCGRDAHDEVAVALATALSGEVGAVVMLIDGALSAPGPGLTDRFDRVGQIGLDDVLADAGGDLGIAHLPLAPTLGFVGAGTGAHGRAALPEVSVVATLARLRGVADYLVLVQGAALDDPRYLAFLGDADLILLTVVEGSTPMALLTATVERLKSSSNCHVGLLVTVPTVDPR